MGQAREVSNEECVRCNISPTITLINPNHLRSLPCSSLLPLPLPLPFPLHSMWKYVTQSGMILHALNTQCLCFIALMSYSIELMMSFDEDDEQRRHAVTFWLSNVLLISLCILTMGAGIFSKYNTLPRDEKERLNKRTTRKWTFVSGLLLPFWTLLGIIVTLTIKEGQRAWSIAIGLQIILHPISQLIVFWRYMLAYKKEREGVVDEGDDDEGGLTRSLLGDAKRSSGGGTGIGGHSTISRGYYYSREDRGNYDDDEGEEQEEREREDWRRWESKEEGAGFLGDGNEIEGDAVIVAATVRGKSTPKSDPTKSAIDGTQADETQIMVDSSLVVATNEGRPYAYQPPVMLEDEKKVNSNNGDGDNDEENKNKGNKNNKSDKNDNKEPPQAAFDLLARQLQGMRPPLKPESIKTPHAKGSMKMPVEEAGSEEPGG